MLRIIIGGRPGEPPAPSAVRRAPARAEAHAPGPGPTALRVSPVADVLVRAPGLGGPPAGAGRPLGPDLVRDVGAPA